MNLSGCLSITEVSVQFITWFSCPARLVICYTLLSYTRALTSGKGSFGFWLDFRSVLLTRVFFLFHLFCHSWHTELCIYILLPVLSLSYREEGIYQLSHVFDYFLGTTLTYCAKNWKKKWCFHSLKKDSSGRIIFRLLRWIINRKVRSM